MKDYASYLGAIALLVSILTLVYHYFGWVLSSRKEMSDLEIKFGDRISAEIKTCPLKLEIKSASDKLEEISERLVRVETKMELFWNQVGGAVKAMIKQPIHFKKDELMDKLLEERKPKIRIEELYELKSLLKEELPALIEVKSEKCLAYALALAYIDQILYDRNCLCAEEAPVKVQAEV